jgi:N-acetylglutamate synthase-like GNAT family acetyltransferase
MDDVTLRAATTADLPAIASFIVRMNPRPDQRCLHCGDAIADVEQGLAELGLPPEKSLLLAHRDGRLVGLVAADFAGDVGRGWLWGPFVEHPDAEAVCDRLMSAFLASAPGDIRRIDSFLATGNRFDERLARNHGFAEPRGVHIYRAPSPGEAARAATPPPVPASPEHLDPLATLHEASFPGTWRSAAEMIAGDDASATFVALEEGRFRGYVHVEADATESLGHVHFLAVVPEARGGGVGRRLLQQGMDWIANARGLEAATLTVLDTLTDARSLYESVGFRLTESGVTRRWQR